jgi:hypothetical protein
MTLPSSGKISIGDINEELGRARTTKAALGDADLRALAGVPSGLIKLLDFYGKSFITLEPNHNFGAISSIQLGLSGAPNTAITFNSTGSISVTADSVDNPLSNWANPAGSGVGDNYEIRATKTGGNATPADLGTWLALTSNRSWSVSAPPQAGQITFADVALTIEIRKVGGSVEATHTCVLSHTNNQDGGL